MSKNSEAVKRWRRNAKARLIRGFGGSCCICGYNKCDEVMEFHHLIPSDKETNWGKIRGNIQSWHVIATEMQKCVMLCSNCHKEVHAGVAIVPENAPRLNTSVIDYKADERKQFMDACPYCGTQKRINTKTCKRESCKLAYRSRVKKVDWINVDAVALYNEHKNYTVIGDMFGVTGATVSRRHKIVLSKLK